MLFEIFEGLCSRQVSGKLEIGWFLKTWNRSRPVEFLLCPLARRKLNRLWRIYDLQPLQFFICSIYHLSKSYKICQETGQNDWKSREKNREAVIKILKLSDRDLNLVVIKFNKIDDNFPENWILLKMNQMAILELKNRIYWNCNSINQFNKLGMAEESLMNFH